MSELNGNRVSSPIQEHLEQLHATYSGLHEGAVATYIPELAKADPNWFGVCIATTDGHIYEVGDTRQPFTIQSISKPFIYGLALEDVGRAAVLEKIGVEPTGDAFNSISLAPGTGCPLNPMINAGAIAATSLIAGHSTEDRLYRLLTMLSLYAGRSLSIDQAVYQSEKETGHRNRAIGHMLRNFDILTVDPEPTLDLYFQQCSVAVDCRDLSVMAATLANGGVNPLTGERAVRQEFVDGMLSVMTTCGMYDSAGEWVYWVGMPAKSGVAGGVVAVLPGQLGIGVFSPRLDPRGNSVRGVRVCADLSSAFNLHSLRVPRSARSAIRVQYSIAEISSKRRRGIRERHVLDAVGRRARVYDLQGDLGFAAIEAVIRTLVEDSTHLSVAILDLKRVTQIDQSATRLLLALLLRFDAVAKQLLFANVDGHSPFVRCLEEGVSNAGQARLLTFAEIDAALEWCENRLLSEADARHSGDALRPLAEHELTAGLGPDALVRLESMLERKRFGRGELIIRKGEAADTIYLLKSGEVSVTVDLPNGQLKRLATFSAGMTFGELAVVNRTVRSADVRADTAVQCDTLSTRAFHQLGETYPQIKLVLLENLLRNVARMVDRLNQEVTTLAQ